MIRIYVFSDVGRELTSLVLIYCVGAGQALPLPSNSGPAGSSSWKEESFEMEVLNEPFSETEMESTNSSRTVRSPWAGPSEVRNEQPGNRAGVARDDAGSSTVGPSNRTPLLTTSNFLQLQIDSILTNEDNRDILLLIEERFSSFCFQPETRASFSKVNFDSLNYEELVIEMLRGYPFFIHDQSDLDNIADQVQSKTLKDRQYLSTNFKDFLFLKYPDS